MITLEEWTHSASVARTWFSAAELNYRGVVRVATRLLLAHGLTVEQVAERLRIPVAEIDAGPEPLEIDDDLWEYVLTLNDLCMPMHD